MLENKWKHGYVKFVLPTLSKKVLPLLGLKPWALIVDETIGPEIVLLITESEAQTEIFRNRDIIGFWMKSGLVNTSYGHICWLLFYFPNPITGENIIYENILNPNSSEHISIYEQLSNQKYWHVIIADNGGTVVNFFEFKNNYNLSETLCCIKDTCTKKEVLNFISAKTEFEKDYSIKELMRI